jgi:hypothetical protein
MSKMYGMKDLGISALIGRKINSAQINAEKNFVVLDTNKGPLFLTWIGDCCAKCYLENVSGVEHLIGHTVLSANNSDWTRIGDEEYDVLESMGTVLNTDRGTVNFETRVSHNGYYGGEISVSDDEPMDQYISPAYEELPKLEPLSDF